MQNQPEQLLTRLREGEISSECLTRYYCDANQQHAQLNALCLPRFEEALSEAEHRDRQLVQSGPVGPLHGLPVTIKECFDLKGTPSTFGLLHRAQDIPDTDDLYVDALQKAGAVIIGKTNVSQLLAYIETDNPVYGSSGGEGALVGAGLSPLGIGTDVGGSIRVPAAVNGVCAIKPTGQRLKDKTRLLPEEDEFPITSAVGPLSQDASTLYAALEVMNQAAKANWDVEPLRDYKKLNATQMKIGYFVDDGIFPSSGPVKHAVRKAVSALQARGAKVIEYRFPDLDKAQALFYAGMSVENGRFLLQALGSDKPAESLASLIALTHLPVLVRRFIAALLSAVGQKQQSRILNLIGRYGMQDTPRLRAQIADYSDQIMVSMQQTEIGALDAVISPILPVPGYLNNSFKQLGLAGAYSLVNNVTGFPAGIACVGKVQAAHLAAPFSAFDLAERRARACVEQSEGLPLSVQITALPWREDVVLALIDALHQPYTQALTLPAMRE